MTLTNPTGPSWTKARLGALGKRIDEVKRGVNGALRRASRSPMAGTTAERNDAYGAPATVAERVALASLGPLWHNRDTGRSETYLAGYSDGAPARATAEENISPGWYPAGGVFPALILVGTETSMTAPSDYSGWRAISQADDSWRNLGSPTYGDGTDIVVNTSGRYRVAAQVGVSMGSGPIVLTLDVRSASRVLRRRTARFINLDATHTQVVTPTFENVLVRSGERVSVSLQEGSGLIGGTETQMAIFYVAPPAVSR